MLDYFVFLPNYFVFLPKIDTKYFIFKIFHEEINMSIIFNVAFNV